ncbi:unnamed protein product, partial [Tetraodon nigroviridis]
SDPDGGSERSCAPERDAPGLQRHGGRNPHGPHLTALRFSFQSAASLRVKTHATLAYLQTRWPRRWYSSRLEELGLRPGRI